MPTRSPLISAMAATAALMVPASGIAASLEEVIVTAQRRAENLQEIPVAVTALSQDAIDKADVHDLATLAGKVPGLSFSPFSPGQNIVSLRGAASNDDGAGTDNSVAMFVDDVYLGRVSNINPEMFDVERIEVLRGPQGTLYGKNTIGGAINVVSIKPDLDGFSGKAKLNIGNYARTDFSAYVNGPLSERMAGKFSVSLRQRDGWVDNVVLNKKQKDDNVYGMRGQLLWQDSGFEALFSFDYQKLDAEDMARIPVNTGYAEVRGLDDSLMTATNRGDYVTVNDLPDDDLTPANRDQYYTINGLNDAMVTADNYATYFTVKGEPDHLASRLPALDDPDAPLDAADTLTDAKDTRIDPADVSDPATWASRYAVFCGAERNPECAAGVVDGYAKREAQGVSARLKWQLDGGELISITAIRSSEADWNMDSTGVPAPSHLSPPGTAAEIVRLRGPFGLALIDDILDKTDQISQEIRWTSQIGDNLDYTSGFWYLSEETDRTECFDTSLASDCTPDADGLSEEKSDDPLGDIYGTDWYRQVNETTSYALFGQADYRFSDQWKLTFGARYSSDEKSIENFARRGAFVIINQTFESVEEESWSAFTPKLALTYTEENWSAYALFSQGFKSGGFPAAPQNASATVALDQEEALNLEVGFKGDFTDSLRIHVAAFSTKYTDLQIQSFGPVPGGENFGQFRSFNAGDAEIIGMEIEATYVVNENLLLSGFYGFQDSELVDAFVPNSPFADQSGQDMTRTPENKFNLNLEYVLPLGGGGELAFDIGWHHTSQQRGELAPYAVQDGYHLLDASVSWANEADQLKIALWGRNLGDDEYTSHLYTVAGGVVAVFGEPLMMGLSATYNF